jgi:hypothetical protein
MTGARQALPLRSALLWKKLPSHGPSHAPAQPEPWVNTPEAKDTCIRIRPATAEIAVTCRSASLTPYEKVAGTSPAAFASAFKRHRCEQPLRMDAPPTGWVTALAGLLARGSSSAAGLPGFPVAKSGYRFAAHSCGGSHGSGPKQAVPRSLFPLRSDRRTSARAMIPSRLRASQDHAEVSGWHAKDTKNLYGCGPRRPGVNGRMMVTGERFELFSRFTD